MIQKEQRKHKRESERKDVAYSNVDVLFVSLLVICFMYPGGAGLESDPGGALLHHLALNCY